jgi:TonB family protein
MNAFVSIAVRVIGVMGWYRSNAPNAFAVAFLRSDPMRTRSAKRITAIFLASTLLPAMPLLAQDAAPVTATAGDSTTAPVHRIGGNVTPPKVLHRVDPQITEQARNATFKGVVLVNLIVDVHGNPQNVHVLQRVGMGLDENAVAAVKQYRFEPALEGGKPVPVELNVEVNFEVSDNVKVSHAPPRELFSELRILHSVPLELSEETRAAHVSGGILLAFTVDTRGNPKHVHVVQGVGMNMDQRAVQALQQYRFQPIMEDGHPVEKPATIQLKFHAQ